jgi:peptidoglycan/LPS O-acetylase OafA/YrhL
MAFLIPPTTFDCQLHQCFSLKTNFAKLISPNNDDNISCLTGIKAITTLVVFFIHHVIITISYPFADGGVKLALIDRSYLVSTALAAPFPSMDTFMIVSGLLVGNHFVTRGRIVMWKFLVRRYMRLMPSVLVLFMAERVDFWFSGFLSRPFYRLDSMRNECSQHWWSVLLNLQTVVNPNDMVWVVERWSLIL